MWRNPDAQRYRSPPQSGPPAGYPRGPAYIIPRGDAEGEEGGAVVEFDDDDGEDDGRAPRGFGPAPVPPPGRYARPWPHDDVERPSYRYGPAPPPLPLPPARRFERVHDECGWIGRRARSTGSRYWWHRFDECRANGYDVFAGDRD